MKMICIIKEIYRSFISIFYTGMIMSGHDFVDIEEHENCKVVISRCEVCGKIDISWSKK